MNGVIDAIINFIQSAENTLGWLFKYNSQIGASPITWILGSGLLVIFGAFLVKLFNPLS